MFLCSFIPFLHELRSSVPLTLMIRILLQFLLVFLFASAALRAQEINQYSIGTWRDHFPYTKCIDLCLNDKGLIFCATPYGVFTFNTSDKSVERFNKCNGLSDVQISAMDFDATNKAVVVGYENGNIDLIFENGTVNIPDIKLSTVVYNKRINDILAYRGLLYLSTGFGVVVVDPQARQVKNTFYLGPNGGSLIVNSLCLTDDIIFAATESGLRFANVNDPFLQNFNNWSDITTLPSSGAVKRFVTFVGQEFIVMTQNETDQVWKRTSASAAWEQFTNFDSGQIRDLRTDGEWLTLASSGIYQAYHFDLFLNYNQSNHAGFVVNANSCIVDRFGGVWAADNNHGLLWREPNGNQINIVPPGPKQIESRKLQAYNDNFWIAPGGVTPFWGNLYNSIDISARIRDNWSIVPDVYPDNPDQRIFDNIDVAIDPKNNDRVFLASWYDGLVEVNNRRITKIHNTSNSTLQYGGLQGLDNWVGVGGVDFDLDANLWFTNAYTSRCIQVLKNNGTFKSFNFSPAITNQDVIADVMASQAGFIWTIVPGKGILVFNPNETIDNTGDDSYKILNDQTGQGGLPTKDVLCFEEDINREVWVGTLEGLTVFYNQDAIFSDQNFDAQQIKITQDGNVQILLETEAVTAIRIDGANRKWIGTQNSGVYLFSEDGLNEIYHFTKNNSPLPSNVIYDIAINQASGEVYFATDLGIVGYFGTATNFDNDMKSVRAFPNPVAPDYSGNITIDGLAYDSSVKVTDLQGNVVFETRSEGGRAVWNGLTSSGARPTSGVYIVYAADKDGSVAKAAAITFIK